jgi:hypothetical protein
MRQPTRVGIAESITSQTPMAAPVLQVKTITTSIVSTHHLNREMTGPHYTYFSHFYHGMPTTR